jgi:hypothetical protein
MKTVHKYKLLTENVQVVLAPAGWSPIYVGVQFHDGVVLWATVDTDQPLVEHAVITVGTGHPMPDYKPGYLLKYVGTYTLNQTLWLHVFVEVVEAPEKGGK